MRDKKIFFYLVLAFCCSNCITIEINRSGTYSNYDKLTPSEKNRVVFPTDKEQIYTAADSVVFAVTADLLKQYMNQFDACFVYFWNATCPSSYWKSPIDVQNYCKKNNLHFILIVKHYDHVKKLFEINPSLAQPAFVMDSTHYGSDKCKKYIPKFRKELLGDIDKKYRINYWLYRNGVFEKCLDLEER